MTKARCSSTKRMLAGPETSAAEGRIEWAPAKSLWTGGMLIAAVVLGPIFVTPAAVSLFIGTTTLTLCAGHSVGMHRLLVHRSFSAKRWVEYVLVYLGTLVGMAGPFGMIRLHDMRDWAQRQPACHELHANRAPLLRDACLQMHARLRLAHPPRFLLEPEVAEDRILRWLERTWMLQQLPLAALFYAVGGVPWLVWGIPVRIACSLMGHWLVVHLTHRDGPQGWVVDGEAVQGHDLPAAAWLTFGEGLAFDPSRVAGLRAPRDRARAGGPGLVALACARATGACLGFAAACQSATTPGSASGCDGCLASATGREERQPSNP